MYLDKQGRRWFRGNLHAHSTVSDGVKTPEEVADLYRNQCYDFLAITDHWKPSRAGTDQGLLLLPGCEYDVGNTAAAGIYHIVAIGPEQLVVPKRTDGLTAQEVLDGIREAGGYAILAHPSWSLNQPGEICKLKGVDASEIYNTLSDVPWNGRRGDSSVILDTAAALGTVLPLVASDDSHFYTGEACRSFIWLQAEELTQEAVLDSLRAGRFYASQGPRMETEWDGEVLRVRCSPAQMVVFYSDLVYSGQRVAKGFGITQAEYRPGGNETFLRAEVIDADGKKAWSSPVVLR